MMSSAAEKNDEAKSSSSVGSLAAADNQQIMNTTSSSSSDAHQNGGGLFNYLISRKKIHHGNINTNTPQPLPSSSSTTSSSPSRKEERMKYHRLANAAGSQYFGSLSIPLFHDDSDSDNDDNNHKAATTTATAATLLSAANDNQQSSSSSSSSWMNKAWQTVDSATDWMSSPLIQKLPSANNNHSASEQQQQQQSSLSSSSSSSWWTVPSSTISNAFSSINLTNPFKDDKNKSNDTIIQDNHSSSLHNHHHHANNNNHHNNNLLLPKIASRFEWATKRRNPYQIGRGVDTDYYLLSSFVIGPVSSLLRWIPSTLWFQGELENGGRLEEGNRGGNATTTGGVRRMNSGVGDKGTTNNMVIIKKKKSLPSEASVMAVKNLLVLVQQQQQQQQQNYDDMDDNHNEEHQQSQSLPQQPRYNKSSSSPIPTPGHSPPSSTTTLDKSFTPRSPSIQPFPDFPDVQPSKDDSSSFESDDHSPTMLNELYPSPRMTPVQSSFHQAQQHPTTTNRLVPSPLTLPKASSSPIIRRHRSSSFQNSTNAPHNGNNNMNNNNNNNQAADAEMAARLTEGTLRAYRDLALDEATELHSALHHWTLRWERPFLGWLEAGPTVWFSDEGYSPYVAGKKVSQIQAVLARRCAVIGEIQQHLWRASWQRGVANWAMLGHGQGEWAAVMLEHGDMTTDVGGGATPGPSPQNSQQQQQQGKKKRISMKIFNHSSFVGGNVSNSRGGQILVDEDALTRWSIDGIKVVRDQLYRAGSLGCQLPYYENWPNEVRHFNGDTIVGHSDMEMDHPTWAKKGTAKAIDSDGAPSKIIIKDLPGMADEVSSLLQSIELNLDQQRQRRLNKLRPPSSIRRNWYMFALGVPAAAYATYHVCKEHGGYFLLKEVLAKISEFCKEHISEPCYSIYQELFTRSGRIDVNDRKARIDTIESLKRMIRAWLDDTFADMPEAEKISMSNNMDISLIEQLKEESIKHIYEINSVVRCSLIEMQFIKKELLNALVAMDELMGSNEINARLAAMTPAVILVIAVRRVFRLVFYALFKFGAPKQEIYASFRKTILDMERLLLMRDNPPPHPESLSWGSTRHARSDSVEAYDTEANHQSRQTLTAADLGMLLLHIHECRTILWENRRRFDNSVLRNVSEDLAEIAGERGPVSVRQQLQILSRMSRTYKFMKVDYRSMMG